MITTSTLKENPETAAVLKARMNELLDLLKWFHQQGIKLHISPDESGWKIQFSVSDDE